MNRLFAGTPFDIPPKCDDCGNLESECTCTAAQKAEAEAARQRERDRLDPSKQTARISVQKRKGGRKVTVVAGLASKANDFDDLLAQLQTACGTGGTTKPKEDLIELQGDHSARIQNKLHELGFKTKRL